MLLLLGLLGGGLACLLVVNTTLAANSIRISELQQVTQAGTQRIQELRQQIDIASSASVIAREARRLHMRYDDRLRIVDLGTGKIVAPHTGAPHTGAPGTGAPSAPPRGPRRGSGRD